MHIENGFLIYPRRTIQQPNTITGTPNIPVLSRTLNSTGKGSFRYQVADFTRVEQ